MFFIWSCFQLRSDSVSFDMFSSDGDRDNILEPGEMRNYAVAANDGDDGDSDVFTDATQIYSPDTGHSRSGDSSDDFLSVATQTYSPDTGSPRSRPRNSGIHSSPTIEAAVVKEVNSSMLGSVLSCLVCRRRLLTLLKRGHARL